MKTISHSSRRARGFTLVELLVVIAIIGILAGMSLAVIPHVMTAARKNKARLEAQGIATAILHYDSVYGRFPVSAAAQSAASAGALSPAKNGDFTYGASFQSPSLPGYYSVLNGTYSMSNSEVVAILMDYTTFPNTSFDTINTNNQKNPQKITFLNATMAVDNTLPGVGSDLVYRDPWGNPYVISMDLNYDEKCRDAFYCLAKVSGLGGIDANPGLNGLVSPDLTVPDNFQSHGKVMVWSAGPDKQIDNGTAADQGVNKDNILIIQ